MPHLLTQKKTDWASFSVVRRIVKAGDLVEVWDYLDPRLRHGTVPERREVGLRVRRTDNNFRAKRKVRWLIEANGKNANCYFFTATFAEDVDDYGQAVEVWGRFRRFLVREFPEVRYVSVPEVQKNRLKETGKAVWHFHAALIALPSSTELRARFGKMKNWKGQDVDAWMFHFTDMWREANRSEKVNRAQITVVRSLERLTKYVIKYITKETGAFIPADRRCFFAGGKNLLRPITIESRALSFDINGNAKIPAKPPTPSRTLNWGFSRIDKYNGRCTYQRWRLSEKESEEYERALRTAAKSGSVSAPTGTPDEVRAQESLIDNPL